MQCTIFQKQTDNALLFHLFLIRRNIRPFTQLGFGAAIFHLWTCHDGPELRSHADGPK